MAMYNQNKPKRNKGQRGGGSLFITWPKEYSETGVLSGPDQYPVTMGSQSRERERPQEKGSKSLTGKLVSGDKPIYGERGGWVVKTSFSNRPKHEKSTVCKI